eukprot:18762-Heterococcus_DN1.PRE.2
MSNRRRTILDGLRVLEEHEHEAEKAAWERVVAAQKRFNADRAASAVLRTPEGADKLAGFQDSEELWAAAELALSARGAAVDALMTAVEARAAAIAAVQAVKEEIAMPPPTAAAAVAAAIAGPGPSAGAGAPAAIAAAENQLAAGAGDTAGLAFDI